MKAMIALRTHKAQAGLPDQEVGTSSPLRRMEGAPRSSENSSNKRLSVFREMRLVSSYQLGSKRTEEA